MAADGDAAGNGDEEDYFASFGLAPTIKAAPLVSAVSYASPIGALIFVVP